MSITVKKRDGGPIQRADYRLRGIFESLGLSIRKMSPPKSEKNMWDAAYGIEVKGRSLILGLHVKSSAEPRRIYELIGQIRMRPAAKTYPLVYTPYISQRTAQLCREAGIGYLDEIGNCWINCKTILISQSVEAKPAAPRRQSRRLFAPKSLLVIRALLCQPRKDWRQLELSKEAGISLGLVNRIVRRLLESAFAALIDGRVYLKDRKGLLDEWVKADALQRKTTVEYYTPEPIQQFERRLDEMSIQEGWRYALTLFAGARYRAPFVRINRVHLYVQGDIEAIVHKLGLKAVPSGGNVLIIPAKDEGVFFKMQRVQDRNIVSDVQLYVDLKNAHGRAEEQAEALAEHCLKPILQEESPQPFGMRTIEQEAKLHKFLRLRDQGDALLFRSNKALDAAAVLGEAMAIAPELSPEDKGRELDFLRIKLWLARLQAAFRSQDRLQLQGANEIFATDQEVEDLRAKTWFNSGWIKFGLLLKAALKAKWFKDQAASELYKDLFNVVTSSYTESSNDIKPRAEEIRKWMEE